MIQNIGVWQLLILLVIVVLVFGTKRLRSLGGDMGSAIRSFRKGLKEEDDGDDAPKLEADSPDEAQPTATKQEAAKQD